MEYKLIHGDCLDSLRTLEENSIDNCITDPPYGMGMEHWDHAVPTTEIWEEVLRVLKPGGFCLSFCSPQLYHRMATAVEDAGFDIKDQIMWMITTKMPKKNRLKPAHEPIVVAQKPFKGSIKANFEEWGVGQIDTDSTRVPWDGKPPTGWVKGGMQRRTFGKDGKTTGTQKEFGKEDANPAGRYPSNIIGEVQDEHQKYFYAPRVTRKERGEYNDHPTPKPIALMAYLVKVYCPPGPTFIGMELEENYIEISRRRINDHCGGLLEEK
jgi:DNA modification methylase